MDAIAPTRYAEPWDNVGLLAGDPAQPVTRVLLTVDYTAEVAREGEQAGCDAVVAYHPPIFEGLKRITAGTPVFDALRRGVALYSPHTALDVAHGGTNDVLADAVGLAERAPLRVAAGKDAQHKLVVFVPEAALERVSTALFDAGAGRIGNYSSCSFRSPGIGTFFGEEGANPAVGARGRLELSPEVRLETVVPVERLAAIVRALRDAHPYEEPAFDLVRLAAAPETVGLGRIGSLAAPTPRPEVFARIKAALGVERLLIAGPTEGPLRRIAVCAGAAGELVNDAIAGRAELYLTGELRHHDALKAARAGMTVVCTLHSNSERAALGRLAAMLVERLPGLDVVQSAADRDPFAIG
jgi:dinuclear metal center YbgI/SA1388 family protein